MIAGILIKVTRQKHVKATLIQPDSEVQHRAVNSYDLYQVSLTSTRCVKRNCNKVLNIIILRFFLSPIAFDPLTFFPPTASDTRAIHLMRSHFFATARMCSAKFMPSFYKFPAPLQLLYLSTFCMIKIGRGANERWRILRRKPQ